MNAFNLSVFVLFYVLRELWADFLDCTIPYFTDSPINYRIYWLYNDTTTSDYLNISRDWETSKFDAIGNSLNKSPNSAQLAGYIFKETHSLYNGVQPGSETDVISQTVDNWSTRNSNPSFKIKVNYGGTSPEYSLPALYYMCTFTGTRVDLQQHLDVLVIILTVDDVSDSGTKDYYVQKIKDTCARKNILILVLAFSNALSYWSSTLSGPGIMVKELTTSTYNDVPTLINQLIATALKPNMCTQIVIPTPSGNVTPYNYSTTPNSGIPFIHWDGPNGPPQPYDPNIVPTPIDPDPTPGDNPFDTPTVDPDHEDDTDTDDDDNPSSNKMVIVGSSAGIVALIGGGAGVYMYKRRPSNDALDTMYNLEDENDINLEDDREALVSFENNEYN